MTETLIRDIEHHFALLLLDDKITAWPEVPLHFSLSVFPLSVTCKYSWWHTAQHPCEIHKRESSLIPGSPLRTALISRRLWLVGLCLICSPPLALCWKGRLPVPRFGCEVPQTHSAGDAQSLSKRKKQTHKDAHNASCRFLSSSAFRRHCRWPQRHRIVHKRTPTHTQTHVSRSSSQHFSWTGLTVNISPHHTKTMFFHFESFQFVNGIPLENHTLFFFLPTTQGVGG